MTAPVQLFAFQCTVPAGTPISAPVTINMAMPARIVTEIEITCPPGWNGDVGFQLASGGMAFVPTVAGTWIVTSDETLEWSFDNPLESGAWQIIMYNTGTYPHTAYVRFSVGLIGSQTNPAAPATIDPSVLDVADTTPTPTLGGIDTGDGGTAGANLIDVQVAPVPAVPALPTPVV